MSESKGSPKAPFGAEGEFIGYYRFVLAMALIVVYSLQPYVKVNLSGRLQVVLGYALTLLVIGLVVELVTLIGARLAFWVRDRLGAAATLDGLLLAAATVLLAANLLGHHLYGYIFAPPAPLPAAAAAGTFLIWLAFAALALKSRGAVGVYFLGFAGLIVATRALTYYTHPFEEINGDMLAAIDRGLGMLFAGEFPYIDTPRPAMPYWPLTLLSYAAPKLAGIDLRLSNVLVEVATVAVAMFVGFGTGREQASRRVTLQQAVLPLLMIYPTWTFFSAETQYPLSVLVAVLFARTVIACKPVTQAVVLGVAVAANQTFGVFGLLVAPYWIRKYGLMRFFKLTGMSLATCLVLIAPFLFWNPGEFLRVSMMSLKVFTPAQFAGTFTLRPLLAGVFPVLPTVLFAAIIGGGMLLVWLKGDSPSRVVAVIVVGYCLLLVLLHRSFTHYYLPVIAMAAVCPLAWPFRAVALDAAADGSPPPDTSSE
jgi:hypothetical protein